MDKGEEGCPGPTRDKPTETERKHAHRRCRTYELLRGTEWAITVGETVGSMQ